MNKYDVGVALAGFMWILCAGTLTLIGLGIDRNTTLWIVSFVVLAFCGLILFNYDFSDEIDSKKARDAFSVESCGVEKVA